MPDEVAGALLHRRKIERRRDVPHPAAVQRGRRPAVEDAVEIDGDAVAECRASKSGGAGSTAETLIACGRRWWLRALRITSGSCSRARSTWAIWASAWTPASVRPAPNTVTLSPQKPRIAVSSASCTDKPVRLALPADETGAAIFDRQLVAGHGRRVPGGSAKPRRNAAVSSARAARPLQPRAGAARPRRKRRPAARRARCPAPPRRALRRPRP